jgi:hypothetical protein
MVVSCKKLKFLILAIMLFSITLVINPLSSTHRVVGASSIPIASSHVTIIPGSNIKGNTTGSPKNLGNVTVAGLPTASVSTNLANSKETPEVTAVPNGTALAIAKAKSASNTIIPKTQFSLNNLSNSSSTNSSSTNSTAASTVSKASSVISKSSIPATVSFSLQQSNKPITGFAGLNIQTGGCCWVPPDPQLAVGPTVVGEMVNLGAGFWTKDGNLLRIVPLSGFFKTGSDAITDPRIIFDNDTGKWFAYIQDETDDSIHVAVSNGSNPVTGHFVAYSFPFSGCPDQPSVGLSKDKMIISANVFQDHCPKNPQFRGAQFTVVDKADLLSNRNPPKSFQSTFLPNFYSVHVSKVTNSNETSDLYMARLGKDGVSGGNTVSVFTVSGEAPNIQVKNATLNVQQTDVPVGASQPGIFSQNIEVPDSRVQDASFHQGKLWIAAQDTCRPTGDAKNRDCIRLLEVDTTKNSILQDFDLSQASTYLFYPALAIDRSGDFVVYFGYSSGTIDPSLMIAGQSSNGTKNTLDYKIPVATGLSPSPVSRYGDYFGIAIDPIKPKTFWAVGQIIPFPLTDQGTAFWNTFITNFTIPTTQK